MSEDTIEQDAPEEISWLPETSIVNPEQLVDESFLRDLLSCRVLLNGETAESQKRQVAVMIRELGKLPWKREGDRVALPESVSNQASCSLMLYHRVSVYLLHAFNQLIDLRAEESTVTANHEKLSRLLEEFSARRVFSKE